MERDVKDREISSSGLIVIAPPLDDGALDALLAGFRGQVVLVEPDPDRALRLQSREGVRVIAAAIGHEPGQRPLFRFNFPGLRSLFAPTAALKDSLPGLREVGRTMVSVIASAELARQLGDLPEPLALHIDAPGAELMVLQGLATAGVLARVARLQMRCGTVPMVEGAASRAAVQDWIVDQGFVLAADTSDDPDWAELEFRVDLVARALDETRAALKVSEDVAHQQQAQISALKHEAADRDKTITDLETGLAAARKAKAETDSALKQRDVTLKSREDDLAKVTGERDTARGQAEQRNKRITELEATVNAARQTTERAKSDLGVALRMQMLAQSDLRDLQMRFRDVEQARSSQQSLLEKLTPRLQQAARQLQQLQLADTPALLEEKPSDANRGAIAPHLPKSKTKRKSGKKTAGK